MSLKAFSVKIRENNIEKLKNQHFDLLIIGGGITGAGIARDAVSRGMKVGLVNSNDFAFGTSSRSSKLIHGGIRYLENYEFSLVYEALSERAKLFDIAPHLVHPLRFMIPIFKDSRVGMFLMGVGMWLYDILSLFEAPQLHARLSKSDSLRKIPFLKKDNLKGSYVYSDAYMDDDRLVHETLRSANDQGAVIANYIKASEGEFQEGQLKKVKCIDEQTNEEFLVSATHFVSSVGPWTDQLGGSIFSDWKKILRPSKGVHLTFKRSRLPIKTAVVMGAEKSNRIVFAIPRKEMIIIGTTDTDFSDDPGKVTTKQEDVDYILKVANSYFPHANLKEKDIIASYAGVRPLVNDGASTEGKTSREHTIITDDRNVTFVAGGKYTTYRKIAEDCLNAILPVYPFEERVKFNNNDTNKPLNEFVTPQNMLKTQMQAESIQTQTGLSTENVEMLIERHGSECLNMLDKWSGWLDRSVWCLEAMQAIENTMCLHIKDFYFRRTPLVLSFEDHGFQFLEDVGKVFQKYYSWSDEKLQSEYDLLKTCIKQEMSWKDN